MTQRAYQGGHRGSEDTVREIRLKSIANFPRAFDELGGSVDLLNVYDNSAHGIAPRLIASFQARRIVSLAPQIPPWLEQALQPTPYSTPKLLALFRQKQPLPAPPIPT